MLTAYTNLQFCCYNRANTGRRGSSSGCKLYDSSFEDTDFGQQEDIMLPAAAVRDSHNTESSLHVHLQDPQVRPEAFSWGSVEDVEMQASFSAGRHIVSLPCKVDVSEVLVPGVEEAQLGAATNLDVEIIGNDNGVAFTIGNASVPLPSGRELQQTSISDSQFRASLRGATGERTGTLVGSFQVRGSTSLGPDADEAVGATAPPQAGSTGIDCSADPSAGEATDGREAKEHGRSGEQQVAGVRMGSLRLCGCQRKNNCLLRVLSETSEIYSL